MLALSSSAFAQDVQQQVEEVLKKIKQTPAAADLEPSSTDSAPKQENEVPAYRRKKNTVDYSTLPDTVIGYFRFHDKIGTAPFPQTEEIKQIIRNKNYETSN